MVKRLSEDARKAVLAAAVTEAHRSGNKRVGTDHLLLGLLHQPDSIAEQVLAISLADARSAVDRLDQQALAAIGVDAGDLGRPLSRPGRGRPPLTSGARAALHRAVEAAKAGKGKTVEERHLLLGLLGCRYPDPAVQLLDGLGIKPEDARHRLETMPD